MHAETVRRMERATGALGTAAIAAMDERLPWFRNLSAENRSWLGLVAQAGIAAFIDWIRHPERNRPALTEVFGTAPRELATERRRMSSSMNNRFRICFSFDIVMAVPCSDLGRSVSSDGFAGLSVGALNIGCGTSQNRQHCKNFRQNISTYLRSAVACGGVSDGRPQNCFSAVVTALTVLSCRAGEAICNSSSRLMIEPASSNTAGICVCISTMR